jgi:hypothetical protein
MVLGMNSLADYPISDANTRILTAANRLKPVLAGEAQLDAALQ